MTVSNISENDHADSMQEFSEELIGLRVYSPKAEYIGKVDEIVFDIDNKRIDSLIVNNVSPAFAEPKISVAIPYSWIRTVGDIIILDIFPTKILRDGTLEGL